MQKYLCGIAEKYTKKPLTPTIEVEASSPYALADRLETKFGLKVNGETNYVEWLDITESK